MVSDPSILSRCLRVVRARCACCFARRTCFSRTSSACITYAIYTYCFLCRASLARISRVDYVCRTTSARDNKLLSLIDTHANNINSRGRIF